MKLGKYDKKIDELIIRAIGRQRPTFDFDKWRADHQKEIHTYKAQVKKPLDSVESPVSWRIIMKSSITKLAAAAAVIIAVLIGLEWSGGKNAATVAWAKVVENVEQIESYIFQHQISVTNMLEGTTIQESETTTYVSSEFGFLIYHRQGRLLHRLCPV
jgi:hypothetical protein